MLTFFQTNKGYPESLLGKHYSRTNSLKVKTKKTPLFNHFKYTRTKDFYKLLNFTSQMNMDGKPIEEKPAEKRTADSDQMHIGSTMIDGNNWHFTLLSSIRLFLKTNFFIQFHYWSTMERDMTANQPFHFLQHYRSSSIMESDLAAKSQRSRLCMES